MLKKWKKKWLKKSRYSKNPRSFDGDSCNSRLDIIDMPKFKRCRLIMFLKNFPSLVMIECLKLSIKRKEVQAHLEKTNLWKMWQEALW